MYMCSARKMKYCLSNGFELLSVPTVWAVCQDSNVFRTLVVAFVNHTSIIKVNWMIVLPCVVGNFRAFHVSFFAFQTRERFLQFLICHILVAAQVLLIDYLLMGGLFSQLMGLHNILKRIVLLFIYNTCSFIMIYMKVFEDLKGKVFASMYVSGKLPTYPFPNLTFCPKWEVSINFRFGEG